MYDSSCFLPESFHLAFVEHGKAFDEVNRPLVWKAFETKGVSIKNLYKKSKIVISGFKYQKVLAKVVVYGPLNFIYLLKI